MLLLAFSIGATILNTIAGGGQGIILVPLLTILFSFSPSDAVGTNFVAALAGSISSMLSFSRGRIVDFKLGVAFGMIAVPGVILGSVLTSRVPLELFNPTLGLIVEVLALVMFFRSDIRLRREQDQDNQGASDEERSRRSVNLEIAIPLVILTGILAGTFGAGGGLILTPALLIVGVPILRAVGTNRLIAVIYIAAGVIFKSSLGQVNLDFGLWLVMGAIVGGVVGARLVRLQNSTTLRRMVAIVISILGLYLLFQVFS